MPIYPPRNTSTRKKEILDYKVFEFLACIDADTPFEKIEVKASEVKTAMLNYLKARLALNKRYSADDKDQNSIDLEKKLIKRQQIWTNIDFDGIKQYCISNRHQ